MSSYQNFLRDNDAISGALLGGFNEDDKYVVPSSIISELLKIKKLITKYTLEYIVCHAEISDYKINFLIKYVDDNLDNKRYASLYLIENYESMGKKIELSTFVASFENINDVTFFDELKKAFNLYTAEDLGVGKSIKDENEILANILNGNKKTSQIMVLTMGKENRKYINTVLKVLKDTPQFDVIYKIFKEQISLIKIDKNTAKYFNEVKKVLDKLVLDHYIEFSEPTRDYLDQINKEYMQKYNILKQKITTTPSISGKKNGGGVGGGKSKINKVNIKFSYFGTKSFNYDFLSQTIPQAKFSKEPSKDSTSETIKTRPIFNKNFIKEAMNTLNKESYEKTYDDIEHASSRTRTKVVQDILRDNEEKIIISAEETKLHNEKKDIEFTF